MPDALRAVLAACVTPALDRVVSSVPWLCRVDRDGAGSTRILRRLLDPDPFRRSVADGGP
ncbi:hypothetical protein ACIRL2_50855 [Embleya sp. NPDC127516]|uniref:hypothetical protein n=1 Tax=Embleya sp. NPDC127516 TaxID=3363990 RepID=UPI0038210BFE